MKYYSTTEKNEIMPFTATWMDPEMIIPSECTRQRKSTDF